MTEVRQVTHAEALAVVKAHHYLGTLPASAVVNYGIGEPLAAIAAYGPCHAPRTPKGWLELRRLVKAPDAELAQLNARKLPYPKPALDGPREKRIASKWRHK